MNQEEAQFYVSLDESPDIFSMVRLIVNRVRKPPRKLSQAEWVIRSREFLFPAPKQLPEPYKPTVRPRFEGWEWDMRLRLWRNKKTGEVYELLYGQQGPAFGFGGEGGNGIFTSIVPTGLRTSVDPVVTWYPLR